MRYFAGLFDILLRVGNFLVGTWFAELVLNLNMPESLIIGVVYMWITYRGDAAGREYDQDQKNGDNNK